MTAETDSSIYERMIGRVTWLILFIGVAASMTAAFMRGWRFGFGLMIGALLSWTSFWRWRKLADALGGTPQQRSIFTWLLRFAMLIGAAYVTVRYLEVSPAAVFLGLLVSAAAVFVALIFELIHGTQRT